MCLYSKDLIPKIAEEDITCYKILEECPLEDCPYKTPYMEELIKREIIYGIYNFVGLGDRKAKTNGEYVYIGKGYIHTYKFSVNADSMREGLSFVFDNICHIFECIIPKGTKYYEGRDSLNFMSYASEQIKFIKKVK